MAKLKTVAFRNFQSYGNILTTVKLDVSGTTLICGEDLDHITADGVGGNGVGKSTIINAITFALYGKALSGVNVDNLINWINKGNMEVFLTFETDDGDEYTIHRTRKLKGNNVFLSKNGQDITPDSAANTNLLIEEVWGMPFDMYNQVIAYTATQPPFLQQSAKDQTTFIENLFQLTMLSDKAANLKDLIKTTEKQFDIARVSIEAAEREHARLADQIANTAQRARTWSVNAEQQLSDLREQLAAAESIDVDTERALHESLNEYTQTLREAQASRSGYQRECKDAFNTALAAESELTHLRDSKCPYCNQDLQDTAKKIENAEERSRTCEANIERLQTLITDLTSVIDDETLKIDKIKGVIRTRNLAELMNISSSQEALRQKIESITTAVNPYESQLSELRDIVLDPINYDHVNDLKTTIVHQKFLLKLLTKKDSFVRKALLNKNIPYMNLRLRHYMTQLGLPFKVEFTKELTAKISQLSHDIDYGQLSQGQRARVNLGLSFAFMDTLENIHKKRINICMLDEVLDIGLDSIGIQAALRLIRAKCKDDGKAMFVISHRHDQIAEAAFDRRVTVRMQAGFSTIIEHDITPTTNSDGSFDR